MKDLITVNNLMLIKPSWPAIPNIHAYTTTRLGGGSQAPFDTLNLGLSTDDDPNIVNQNRTQLQSTLKLATKPYWLIQTHSNRVIEATDHYQQEEADASFTRQKNVICAVMTADCLPVLIAHKNGTEVAAIHAGWRSLLNGIIENSIDQLKDAPDQYYYWLGPAISQQAFEVGPEVREQFINRHTESHKAFIPSERDNHYYADLYQLAKIRMATKKVSKDQIYGGDYCTFNHREYFYSYRRDGLKSGRMASLIWIDS